jgi:hypothetical protein
MSNLTSRADARNTNFARRRDEQTDDALDPRYLFLIRASARLRLVESRDLTLDEAINGLIDAFRELRPCHARHHCAVRSDAS